MTQRESPKSVWLSLGGFLFFPESLSKRLIQEQRPVALQNSESSPRKKLHSRLRFAPLYLKANEEFLVSAILLIGYSRKLHPLSKS